MSMGEYLDIEQMNVAIEQMNIAIFYLECFILTNLTSWI